METMRDIERDSETEMVRDRQREVSERQRQNERDCVRH